MAVRASRVRMVVAVTAVSLSEIAGRDLSSRELEVLRLAARGMDNEEIAAWLFLSVNTVKTHVRRVLAKLRARDRGHAIGLGYERGLLPTAATGLVEAARPLLMAIPKCPWHAVPGSPVDACEFCARWVEAQRVLDAVEALLFGGRRG